MSGQEESPNVEEDATSIITTRGACLNSEDNSVLSVVVDIQRRTPDRPPANPGQSIDIRTRLRNSTASIAQQTGAECSERTTPSVGGSLAVNISETELGRSITLENLHTRAETRIELVERGPEGRPPPSYTSVGVPETSTSAPHVFRAPPPPPSYEQAIGIRYLDRELPFINVNDIASIWGHRPQPAYCNRCNAMVMTTVESRVCYVTHLSAALSCLFLCWPCMVCPYFMPFFKEVRHHCPACNSFLGDYRPLPYRAHH